MKIDGSLALLDSGQTLIENEMKITWTEAS